MINREDYINQRNDILSSRSMKDTFLPYMWFYYQSMCAERGIPTACTEEQFPQALRDFFRIPVQVVIPGGFTGKNESPEIAINRVIEYFDNLYKNKYDE